MIDSMELSQKIYLVFKVVLEGKFLILYREGYARLEIIAAHLK